MINNLLIYCLSLNPRHLELIKDLNYIPVGLGNSNFNNHWTNDIDTHNGDISSKNEYYGEYTFHYKIWKNNFLPENKWIGFCQYRKFWSNEIILDKNIKYIDFKSKILHYIPKKIEAYESILGVDLYINQFKFSKFIKKGLKKIIFNPSLLIDGNKRTIKFHFDIMHGEGNLDKAISLLDIKEQNDFKNFVNSGVSFSPHNMFICKNKEILFDYYNSLFPWLMRCEEIFGFNNLKGYGLKRIYGFLAERYMSYWFRKYTKYYLLNIYFKDLNDYVYKYR